MTTPVGAWDTINLNRHRLIPIGQAIRRSRSGGSESCAPEYDGVGGLGGRRGDGGEDPPGYPDYRSELRFGRLIASETAEEQTRYAWSFVSI